jgi:type VI secretion system Hcp family effector
MNTSLRLALPAAMILILAALPADAALNAYLELTDEPAGTPIMGGSDQTGREGQVEVYEFHHLMEIPGGMTAVQHQTVIVTIPLDDPSLTALLQKMDTNGDVGVVAHFWQPDGGGAEQNYLDLTLTGAKVVSVEPLSPNNQVGELAALPATVRIRFSYATIEFAGATSYTLTNGGS